MQRILLWIDRTESCYVDKRVNDSLESFLLYNDDCVECLSPSLPLFTSTGKTMLNGQDCMWWMTSYKNYHLFYTRTAR